MFSLKDNCKWTLLRLTVGPLALGYAPRLWTHDSLVGLSLKDSFEFTLLFVTQNITVTHRDVAIIIFVSPERYLDEQG